MTIKVKVLWNKKFPLELDGLKVVKHLHFENTYCFVLNLDWMEKEWSQSNLIHFHFNGDNKFEILNLNKLFSDIKVEKSDLRKKFLVLQVELDFQLLELIFFIRQSKFNCEIDSLNNKLALIFDPNSFLFNCEISALSSFGHNYVYATGSMKSGTTWIEDILNASSDVVLLHEGNTTEFFGSIMPNNIVLKDKYKTKRYIKWIPWDNHLNSKFSGIVTGLLSRSILDFYMSLVGTRIGVDRTPSSINSIVSHVDFFQHTKIVHIIRNPFDVLISQIYHQMNLYRNTGLVDDIFCNIPIQKIIDEIEFNKTLVEELVKDGYFLNFFETWQSEQISAFQLSENSWVPIKIIYFEDFVKFPKNSIRDLYKFLDIDLDYQDIINIEFSNSFKRKTNGRESGVMDIYNFYRKGIYGDYKNYFTSDPLNYMSEDFINFYNSIYY